MSIRATQGVSFPRSGHEIIFRVSRLYFGDEFVYCDANSDKFCGCGRVPCINPRRTFAKNHDFGLRTSPGVPIIAEERYLVQYRSPVWAIASNYKLHLNNHPEDNNREGWEKFAFRDVFFWNRFIDKWVLDYPETANPPLYCTYEALLSNPDERIREVMAFLCDDPLDEERIVQIMQRVNVTARDSISRFEYYDPGCFRELEAAASDRLAELDLPLFGERD